MHLKYIDDHLISDIISKLECETLDSYEVEYSNSLDGFMSALYTIKLKTQTSSGLKERLLIAKFMKGDVSFRESTKAFIQFGNEVFIYSEVLPKFAKLIKNANVTNIKVEDWVAKTYVAKFGYINGLSATTETKESVLVLENMKPYGYTMGPRLYLNSDQLLWMCKPIGEYHALTYALRIINPADLAHLTRGITLLPFINEDNPKDSNHSLYQVLYRVAFDRFFAFYERKLSENFFDINNASDKKLINQLRLLKSKYFEEPTRFLERLRTEACLNKEDSSFVTILHGDYNRNNVLFRYEESNEVVNDVKMIDFQETRYGSSVMDLSFFMYFNTPQSIREDIWMKLLKAYHKHMYATLTSIVNGNINNIRGDSTFVDVQKELENYSFERFYGHFSRFALYGVFICIHFLPWILSTEDECSRISKLFETDMHGSEFYEFSLLIGGEDANMSILDIVRHASKMGYLDYI